MFMTHPKQTRSCRVAQFFCRREKAPTKRYGLFISQKGRERESGNKEIINSLFPLLDDHRAWKRRLESGAGGKEKSEFSSE